MSSKRTAPPSKKSRKSDESSDNSNDDYGKGLENENEDGGLQNPEIVNFDFEARNAEESDFQGIRNFLKMTFRKTDIDLSGLANEIISRNNIGSVIKQVIDCDDSDDDDSDSGGEVLGVVTVVNLMDSKKPQCFEQITATLIDRCIEFEKTSKDASIDSGKFARILGEKEKGVGFIVNERLVNMPAQISLPFFESLWKEIERAEKKQSFKILNYIMIAKTYRESPSESAEEGSSKNRKKSSKKNAPKTPLQRFFVRTEEEIFYDNADASFDYSVQLSDDDVGFGEQWTGDDAPLEPTRTVILFSASKLPTIMARMKELYSQ